MNHCLFKKEFMRVYVGKISKQNKLCRVGGFILCVRCCTANSTTHFLQSLACHANQKSCLQFQQRTWGVPGRSCMEWMARSWIPGRHQRGKGWRCSWDAVWERVGTSSKKKKPWLWFVWVGSGRMVLWGSCEAGKSPGEGFKPGQQFWTESPKQGYLSVVSARMWAGRCTLYLPKELVKLVCIFLAMGGRGGAEPVPGAAASLVRPEPSTEVTVSYKIWSLSRSCGQNEIRLAWPT